MTPEYAEAHGLAWSVIAVYAIGVPCLYALLLFTVRGAVLEEEGTPLSNALSFLDDGYRSQCYMCHVVEERTVIGEKKDTTVTSELPPELAAIQVGHRGLLVQCAF